MLGVRRRVWCRWREEVAWRASVRSTEQVLKKRWGKVVVRDLSMLWVCRASFWKKVGGFG